MEAQPFKDLSVSELNNLRDNILILMENNPPPIKVEYPIIDIELYNEAVKHWDAFCEFIAMSNIKYNSIGLGIGDFGENFGYHVRTFELERPELLPESFEGITVYWQHDSSVLMDL